MGFLHALASTLLDLKLRGDPLTANVLVHLQTVGLSVINASSSLSVLPSIYEKEFVAFEEDFLFRFQLKQTKPWIVDRQSVSQACNNIGCNLHEDDPTTPHLAKHSDELVMSMLRPAK
jgi:hypothetical protein